MTLGVVLWFRGGEGGGGSAAAMPLELVHDFGTVDAGQTVHHVFELTNPLAVELNVDRVSSNCGCTVGRAPQSIPSGSKVEIPVDVDLPDNDERFESAVLVSFKQKPPVKLIMRGNVRRMYPSVIDFGIVRRGESVRREFKFRSDGTRAARVHEVKFDPKVFRVAVQKDPATPLDLVCTVDLINTETAEIAGNIVARLGDANGELVTIACRGKVLQPVEIARRTIAVGTVGSGRSGSAEIDIAAPYGDVLTISSILSSDPAVLKCDAALARRSERGLILPVSVEAGFTGEVFRGTVDLTIDAGGVPHKRSVNVYALKVAAPAGDAPPQLTVTTPTPAG